MFSEENILGKKSTSSQNSESQIGIGRFVIKKLSDAESVRDSNKSKQGSTDTIPPLDDSKCSHELFDKDLQLGSTSSVNSNSEASISQNEHFPRTSTQNLSTQASKSEQVTEIKQIFNKNAEMSVSEVDSRQKSQSDVRTSNSDSSQSESELITSQSESELVTEIKEIFNKNERKSSCSHKKFRKPRRPSRKSKSTNKFSSSDEMLETIDENKVLESSSTESNHLLSKTGSSTGSAIEKITSIGSEIQSATSSIFEKTTNQNSTNQNKKSNINELKADAENLPDPIFRIGSRQ